jgi:DNA-3-methyladenine glycosylase II
MDRSVPPPFSRRSRSAPRKPPHGFPAHHLRPAPGFIGARTAGHAVRGERGSGGWLGEPARRPVTNAAWPEATELLAKDPHFGPLVKRVGPVVLRPSGETPFQALARAIVYQQLAGKAAATIHGRLLKALEGRITPSTVLSADQEVLRGAGLSRNKLAAILDLAERTSDRKLALDRLGELPDEEVEKQLVQVRGIGPWTAQMFLLFDLRRPDVWPVLDLGVRAGWARIMGLDVYPESKALAPEGDRYRPWRSAVAWYCWRAADGGGV